ncbi:MAG TPA: hydroxymethylglutaryl-CoA reductase, partial [Saprospiraceae bacterium]|nr:hydroxymethylglutaryl-CoA reductase [Saprospiraceae bacterium]
HPMAKIALEILGKPSACDLMRYTAALGLAQNFAAVKSLVTTGIQKGHMRMHLQNIINHLGLSKTEAEMVNIHFCDKAISHSAIRTFVEEIRNK